MLIDLLGSTNEHVQRQAAKALANLGVNGSILHLWLVNTGIGDLFSDVSLRLSFLCVDSG